MIEANCQKCNTRTKFYLISKNKYKCSSCNAKLHKCSTKDCIEMISISPFCSKCIGNGLKNGGALVIGGLAVGGFAVLKYIFSNKNKKA